MFLKKILNTILKLNVKQNALELLQFLKAAFSPIDKALPIKNSYYTREAFTFSILAFLTFLVQKIISFFIKISLKVKLIYSFAFFFVFWCFRRALVPLLFSTKGFQLLFYVCLTFNESYVASTSFGKILDSFLFGWGVTTYTVGTGDTIIVEITLFLFWFYKKVYKLFLDNVLLEEEFSSNLLDEEDFLDVKWEHVCLHMSATSLSLFGVAIPNRLSSKYFDRSFRFTCRRSFAMRRTVTAAKEAAKAASEAAKNAGKTAKEAVTEAGKTVSNSPVVRNAIDGAVKDPIGLLFGTIGSVVGVTGLMVTMNQNSESNSKLDKVEKRLEKVEEENKELKEENKKLKDDNSETKRQVKDLNDDNSETKRQVKELEKNNKELQERLDSTREAFRVKLEKDIPGELEVKSVPSTSSRANSLSKLSTEDLFDFF